MMRSLGKRSPQRITYSVVIPVYGNEDSLLEVCSRLSKINESLNNRLEAIFVIDGSPDNSLEILRELLPIQDFRSRLLEHSRNFGSFAAIKTGFASAKGLYIAAMAADLQEPAELILGFFSKLETHKFDVAVGIRESRDDPKFSKLASSIYWSLYKRFVQPRMPSGGVDIFATNRRVAEHLSRLNESNSSLVGLLMWIGFRVIEIPYSRLERKNGKSGWSFKKKFKYLMDSIFSFTSLPISVILFLGVLGTITTSAIGLLVFITWLVGGISVPGYAAQMLVQLFSSGSLLFALGIVGTYTWRTYENSKIRPSAIVMSDETY